MIQSCLSKSLNRLKEHRWLVAVLGMQVALNLFVLGSRVLWLDEAYSAVIARLPLMQIPNAMLYDAGPPLYYMLLHFWIQLVGESEFSLRLLSLLFSLFATVGVYVFLSLMLGRISALLTTCFFAFSPLMTYYAQETRNYTLLAALTVWLLVGLTQVLFNERRWGFWLAVGTLTAMLYTHNMAWFIALALLMASFLDAFVSGNRQRVVQTSLVVVIAFVLYLPWIPVLLQQMKNTHLTIDWVAQVWSPAMIIHTLLVFIPGGMTPLYMDLPIWPVLFQWITAMLFLVSLMLCVKRLFRRSESVLRFLGTFFVLALIGPYAYSLLFSPVYLPGRTDFALYPLWCLLLGCGVASLPKLLWRRIELSGFILLALGFSLTFLLREDRLTERDVTRYIASKGTRGDVVLCTGLTRPQMEYALKPHGFQILSYPLDMEKHLAHFNERRYIETHNLEQEVEEVMKQAVSMRREKKTLWIVGSERRINQPLFNHLKKLATEYVSKPIQSPSMGLRRLNEPLFLIKIEKK